MDNQRPSTILQLEFSSRSCAVISDLISAGAGSTPSDVIEKMLLSVLPEFRSQHARLQQLEQENALLLQQLQSMSVAAGENEEAEDVDNSGLVPTRRLFFKDYQDLDLSARRKRKAKFCRAIIGLSDSYGIDIPLVGEIVSELCNNSATLSKHVEKRRELVEAKLESVPVSSLPPPTESSRPSRQSSRRSAASMRNASGSTTDSHHADSSVPPMKNPPSNSSRSSRLRRLDIEHKIEPTTFSPSFPLPSSGLSSSVSENLSHLHSDTLRDDDLSFSADSEMTGIMSTLHELTPAERELCLTQASRGPSQTTTSFQTSLTHKSASTDNLLVAHDSDITDPLLHAALREGEKALAVAAHLGLSPTPPALIGILSSPGGMTFSGSAPNLANLGVGLARGLNDEIENSDHAFGPGFGFDIGY